jgi:endonuclease YncB( thermonuclease family)
LSRCCPIYLSIPARTVVSIAYLLVAACSFTLYQAHGQEADPISARVVGVTDGDNIRVFAPPQLFIKVRVEFIDAPEKGQPFGTRAKQAMSNLVFDRQVELYSHSTDRYGRLIAMVYMNGSDVGLELIKEGMAWPFDRYLGEASTELRQRYLDEAKYARESRLGLWSEPNPIKPWDWRHALRPGSHVEKPGNI